MPKYGHLLQKWSKEDGDFVFNFIGLWLETFNNRFRSFWVMKVIYTDVIKVKQL